MTYNQRNKSNQSLLRMGNNFAIIISKSQGKLFEKPHVFDLRRKQRTESETQLQ